MECDRVSESLYDPPKVLSRLDLFARMGFIEKWAGRDLNPDHSGDVSRKPRARGKVIAEPKATRER